MGAPFSLTQASILPPTIPIVGWTTIDGREFQFRAYGIDAQWLDQPALYIFARSLPLSWVALYIGEASNLRERLATHEKWSTALTMGMTAIHVCFHVGGVSRRKADESALIRAYDPPLNVQHSAGVASRVLLGRR